LQAAVSAIPAASDEPEAVGFPAESPKARSPPVRDPRFITGDRSKASGRGEKLLNSEAEGLVRRLFFD
jgi:hypothetical protein